MTAADKIINNKTPKRAIAIFFVMLAVFAVISGILAAAIADVSAKYQIEAYLSGKGGGGISSEPDESILQKGEAAVSDYGISRDMPTKIVYGRNEMRKRIFFAMFGISAAASLLWLIFSMAAFMRIGDELEKLREECIASANSLRSSVRLYGSANDTLRRTSESAKLLSDRLEYLSRTLEADKVYLSEFLGDFSHQIKNALAVVRLNTDILADGERLSQERRDELTDEIQLNLDDMELLVVQAIKLARLDKDTVDYKMERQPAADICERAIKRITPVLRQKGILLKSELPRDIELLCDRSWLCEAIENILKNSADHSGCTEIGVKLDEDPALVRITLTDNGKGIPQKDISRLFERFAKKSSDITMKSAGLGLAIAQNIVRQHGGDIMVYSEEGSGTSFDIVFIKA